MSRSRRLVLLTFSAAVLSALVACSGSAPQILYPDARLFLVHEPATGRIAETLRLYVAIRDPDGSDDPARIFLINDESELYWELASESWVQLEYGGDDWYGMPDLRLPDGETFPRGRYRLIVEDRSLLRSESEFFLTVEPGDSAEGFPRLISDDTSVRIVYSEPVVFRVYGRAGELIVSRVLPPGPVPEDVLSRIPDESGVLAFLVSTGEGIRRESGPYPAP